MTKFKTKSKKGCFFSFNNIRFSPSWPKNKGGSRKTRHGSIAAQQERKTTIKTQIQTQANKTQQPCVSFLLPPKKVGFWLRSSDTDHGTNPIRASVGEIRDTPNGTRNCGFSTLDQHITCWGSWLSCPNIPASFQFSVTNRCLSSRLTLVATTIILIVVFLFVFLALLDWMCYCLRGWTDDDV